MKNRKNHFWLVREYFGSIIWAWKTSPVPGGAFGTRSDVPQNRTMAPRARAAARPSSMAVMAFSSAALTAEDCFE
eukprot:CAMPEP_0114682060 /NCGR_PEP_ID=MMETSP0191-20121206/56083_1 /TAXON_ID=126664 /ORGANISM="Sorites sp." /LENGTH=74 /DNA_ID=CAMNT_0001961131 /DNA_START=321 /DNA_END=542 /DNA_ORIENTATION=+